MASAYSRKHQALQSDTVSRLEAEIRERTQEERHRRRAIQEATRQRKEKFEEAKEANERREQVRRQAVLEQRRADKRKAREDSRARHERARRQMMQPSSSALSECLSRATSVSTIRLDDSLPSQRRVVVMAEQVEVGCKRKGGAKLIEMQQRRNAHQHGQQQQQQDHSQPAQVLYDSLGEDNDDVADSEPSTLHRTASERVQAHELAVRSCVAAIASDGRNSVDSFLAAERQIMQGPSETLEHNKTQRHSQAHPALALSTSLEEEERQLQASLDELNRKLQRLLPRSVPSAPPTATVRPSQPEQLPPIARKSHSAASSRLPQHTQQHYLNCLRAVEQVRHQQQQQQQQQPQQHYHHQYHHHPPQLPQSMLPTKLLPSRPQLQRDAHSAQSAPVRRRFGPADLDALKRHLRDNFTTV